ncbi:MAG: DJ-1/PfpI family protein [Clostridiaceae bacterium]|nr:DJ-1/PfpI family protein [Clostridiaceae bacterium]
MKVHVMLADGFEEIEALSVVDVLRRGQVETVMVSIKNDKIVLGSHDIPVVADKTINDIEVMPEDMIVIPGGKKGVENLSESQEVRSLLMKHQEQKGLLAAICAGPTIPGKMGFYNGVKATCYPGCENDLEGAIISNDDVVVDRNFITSRGPATALAFAYTLLSLIKGEEQSKKIQKGMLFI